MVKKASQRKSTGTLMRKALRYLRKNDKRGVKRAKDPNRMSPAALRHTLEGNRTTTADFKKRTGGHYRPGGKGKRGKILISPRHLDDFMESLKVEARPQSPPR